MTDAQRELEIIHGTAAHDAEIKRLDHRISAQTYQVRLRRFLRGLACTSRIRVEVEGGKAGMSNLVFGEWSEPYEDLDGNVARDRKATEQSRFWIWNGGKPVECEGWLVERTIVRNRRDRALNNRTFYLFLKENPSPFGPPFIEFAMAHPNISADDLGKAAALSAIAC